MENQKDTVDVPPVEAQEPLLSDETTARLKSMAEPWDKPSEAHRAGNERISKILKERADDGRELRDKMRHEQILQIPISERTKEEQLELARLQARSCTRKLRNSATNGQDALAKIKTAEEFWAANRSVANQKKIKEYLEQQERVLDQLFWMKKGWMYPPHDPDFVSLEDGLTDFDEFISEYGLIHDDIFSYENPVLRSVGPEWITWALQDIDDPIWGHVPAFFKDTERLTALCAESPATDVFARYGIATALSAYAVRRFKEGIQSHKDGNGEHREIVPFGIGKRLFVEGCWLCEVERLQPSGTKFSSTETIGLQGADNNESG